jgi:E3 ubiquitin-protein ligase RNF14
MSFSLPGYLSQSADTYQSVYDSLVRVEEVDGSKYIYLVIPIVLPSSTSTELSYSFAADTATAFSTVTPLQISHLPPITVKLLLSPFYPVYEPPTIMKIKADLGSESHQWLNKRHLTELEGRILTMWAEDKEMTGEGSGVIWRWWEWIGSGEFLSDLGLLQGDTLRYVTTIGTGKTNKVDSGRP